MCTDGYHNIRFIACYLKCLPSSLHILLPNLVLSQPVASAATFSLSFESLGLRSSGLVLSSSPWHTDPLVAPPYDRAYARLPLGTSLPVLELLRRVPWFKPCSSLQPPLWPAKGSAASVVSAVTDSEWLWLGVGIDEETSL